MFYGYYRKLNTKSAACFQIYFDDYEVEGRYDRVDILIFFFLMQQDPNNCYEYDNTVHIKLTIFLKLIINIKCYICVVRQKGPRFNCIFNKN